MAKQLVHPSREGELPAIAEDAFGAFRIELVRRRHLPLWWRHTWAEVAAPRCYSLPWECASSAVAAAARRSHSSLWRGTRG